MIGRPCKPDNDLKGLWRMLLGTPFPACGMPEDPATANDGKRNAAGFRRAAATPAPNPAYRKTEQG